ncbi:MAG: porin family protein [Ignavibacteria bacterium]
MKTYLLIPAFLFCSMTVNAQVLISLIFGDELNTGAIEFGLDGGINFTNIQKIEEADFLLGWNLGFYFDIKLKDTSWMVNTGVIVKGNLGAEGIPVYSLNKPEIDNLFSGGSVTRKLNYFSVPVMIKYIFKNNFYLKAGVQLGLMYNGYDTFVKSIDEEDDLQYDVNIKNQYHPLDAGAAIGAGYRLLSGDGINIGVQYYQGFIDVRIDDSSPAEMNSAFYLNVGIPIGK